MTDKQVCPIHRIEFFIECPLCNTSPYSAGKVVK